MQIVLTVAPFYDKIALVQTNSPTQIVFIGWDVPRVLLHSVDVLPSAAFHVAVGGIHVERI